MRKLWLFGALIIFLMISVLPTQAQTIIPIDVFAEHDRTTQQLTLYFTNPVSGLSTPVIIESFDSTKIATYEFTVAATGVLFKNPQTGQPTLATLDGRLMPHPFIPQQADSVSIDWVVSPDQNSIAWVEVFPSDTRWISNLYIADINGGTIEAIPLPPESSYDVYLRAMPVALSNDRQWFYYDAGYPLDSGAYPDYHRLYTDLHRYNASTRTHEQLYQEPFCICGAAAYGDRYVRLLNTDQGIQPQIFDATEPTPVNDLPTAFSLAGDVYMTDNRVVYYSQSNNLFDDSVAAQFSLVQINLNTQMQTFISPPSAQRFTVQGATDWGLVLVDVFGGATYKFEFATQALTLVSENTWLGFINTN